MTLLRVAFFASVCTLTLAPLFSNEALNVGEYRAQNSSRCVRAFTCRFKMSNYKHFNKMYILVRFIALLFHCTLSGWGTCALRRAFRTKSVKCSGELQSKSSCTSDSKMEIFPQRSNIYRWRIYL